MSTKIAVVIGAGIGGLSASVRLAKLGYSVKVFEANPFIGGKINSEQLGKYRFDMGPSVFTGPEYIKELYDLCNKDFSEFQFEKLKNSFNYFYNDGSGFSLPAEEQAMITTLSENLNEDPRLLSQYLRKSAKVYELTKPVFIESSLHRLKQLFTSHLWRTISHLKTYKLSSTMHKENSLMFKNPKTVQFFNRYATYNGSDPYLAPAMLNMIPHLELNIGTFLPKNGMVQIPESIYQLALSLGVEFHLNEKVLKINTNKKTVIGIETQKQSYQCDIVFSNMDVTFTYEKLMPQEKAPEKILKQEKSSSAIVFYWGIKKEFPALHVHNILFSDDYKAEFEAIFKTKTLYHDPTIYINITSKSIPSDAPKGGENWFVMINAPHINGQDWETFVKECRHNMIQKINTILKTDIESFIEVESVMHPEMIEKKYSGKSGSIYGNASNNKYAAFLRHPNFSKNIKGLYFVGVTVHPGGGIPLAINSAKIAVNCLKEDYSIKSASI
jgi:phytoene desaturase